MCIDGGRRGQLVQRSQAFDIKNGWSSQRRHRWHLQAIAFDLATRRTGYMLVQN